MYRPMAKRIKRIVDCDILVDLIIDGHTPIGNLFTDRTQADGELALRIASASPQMVGKFFVDLKKIIAQGFNMLCGQYGRSICASFPRIGFTLRIQSSIDHAVRIQGIGQGSKDYF